MKGEINSDTIIVGDFNTPLTPMYRSTKHKISKETQTLNDTTDQLDLIDIYRTFHPETMNFTFSSSHRTFSRIDHILGHKSSLGKFKNIEIISRIFWSQCGKIRCELQEKLLKIPTYGGWKTCCWITNKSQRRNQNMHRNERKWKHNNPKPMGHCKTSAKGKVHSNTGLPQETRKKSNK